MKFYFINLLVPFFTSFFVCFILLRIIKTKREIKEITNKIEQCFKHTQGNLKYYYRFSTNYSDYIDSTTFSSSKEYTYDEFYGICKSIIENIVISNINNADINDSIRKYFRMDTVLKEEFNLQMSIHGFEIHELEVSHSFDIDAYSFIKYEFKEELSDIIFRKCKINGTVTNESNFKMWLVDNNLEFLIINQRNKK